MQLIKNIIKSKDKMFILHHTIIDCILYQWQTIMDLNRSYIAKSGQQIRSFTRKP
jgi:hypothetical protein